MGDSVKSCGKVKENEYGEKSRICCQENVFFDFHQGCFCAVRWTEMEGLKLVGSYLAD